MKFFWRHSQPPWQGLGRSRSVQLISQVHWPVLVGLCAGMCGLLMLGAAWYLQRLSHRPPATTPPALLNQVPGQQASKLLPPLLEISFEAPAPNTHLDDLARLFKLAREQGVKIGTIEHRLESHTTLPLLIRTLDLRLSESYPKLKIFVAELLSTMPHVSLQEIRVERKDATAMQKQIMLKLFFVYQTPAKSSSVAAVQYRTRNPDGAAGGNAQ